jgi:hypothetical protein
MIRAWIEFNRITALKELQSYVVKRSHFRKDAMIYMIPKYLLQL